MKILITGTKGLADALGKVYSDHSVTLVSKSTGHDIKNITAWGSQYIDHDMVFNCAYDEYAQVNVLEFFFNHWKNNSNKTIISIGSKAVYGTRIEKSDEYWSYCVHKLALQSAHDNMIKTASCDLKIFNPGPIDTDMIAQHHVPKYSTTELATIIKDFVANPTIKRVDLWV
jgi:hypothetical protein